MKGQCVKTILWAVLIIFLAEFGFGWNGDLLSAKKISFNTTIKGAKYQFTLTDNGDGNWTVLALKNGSEKIVDEKKVQGGKGYIDTMTILQWSIENYSEIKQINVAHNGDTGKVTYTVTFTQEAEGSDVQIK